MAHRIEFDEELNLGSRGGILAWLEFAAILGVMEVVSRLPRATQRLLVDVFARVAMRFDKRHREAAVSFMSQALGEEVGRDQRTLKQAYVHLFQMSIDSHAFDRKVHQDKVLEHINVTVSPEVREILDSGTGGFLVSVHGGDWEAGGAAMHHVGMSPAYGVGRPPKNRYLARHLLRVRERKHVTVIPRRGGIKYMPAILESGGWVALLLDQRPSYKSILAPFFGRMTTCERSAAKLLKRMEVPVVFTACYLTDRPFHYEMELARVLTPEAMVEMSLLDILTFVNREMERLILAHPEQYLWLHDRYRNSPPVETADEVPAQQAVRVQL